MEDDTSVKRERYWKTVFDESAQRYESYNQIIQASKQGAVHRVEICLRIVDKYLNGSQKILDVGCGSGVLCRILAQRGYSVIGLDYSEPMIRKAVEECEGQNILYGVGEICLLPIRTGAVDVAVCIGVLQCIDREKEAVSELKRVLQNESGFLVLMTLNSLSVKTLYEKAIRLFLSLRGRNGKLPRWYNVRRYNPLKLTALLKQNGFRDVRFEGVYIMPKYARFLGWLFDKLDTRFGIQFLIAAQAFVMTGRMNEGKE